MAPPFLLPVPPAAPQHPALGLSAFLTSPTIKTHKAWSCSLPERGSFCPSWEDCPCAHVSQQRSGVTPAQAGENQPGEQTEADRDSYLYFFVSFSSTLNISSNEHLSSSVLRILSQAEHGLPLQKSKHLCAGSSGDAVPLRKDAASLPLWSSGSLQASPARERCSVLSAVRGDSHYPYYPPQGNQVIAPVSDECPSCFLGGVFS